jgi:DNA polymerase-3 subunit gamma/tau
MTSEVIIDRLMKISEAEGISLKDDGARLIARASRGGMRDAVSLLELCAGSREDIDAALVSSTIGTGDRDIVYKLVGAISRSDYSAVYETVERVVSGSADISVFWQEIIDTYRDIMVVKNSDTAKSYLDLTDGEFRTLLDIAKSFSMAKLAYHTSILSATLGDMQRSANSKRSVAEIALTKMCDSRTVASPEALALRVEELEKQISMIKMGAVSIKQSTPKEAVPVSEAAVSEPISEKIPEAPAKESKGPALYGSWSFVVERIAEIKPQLASGLKKAQVFVLPDGTYLVSLDSFYAERLMKNESDMAILRGAIAEKEGAASVSVKIKSTAQSSSNLSDEIENALKF